MDLLALWLYLLGMIPVQAVWSVVPGKKSFWASIWVHVLWPVWCICALFKAALK